MQYQRKSPRREDYDYTSPGGYFVTIICKDRERYFGEIENGKMILSDVGIIVQSYRNQIPDHFPYIELDEFIVMPNHIHGILFIADCRDEAPPRPQTKKLNPQYVHKYNNIELYRLLRTRRCLVPTAKPKPGISPKSGSLSVVIGSFKSICTKIINKQISEGKIKLESGKIFARQPRYHDHVIRNTDEYDRIKYYLQTNPQNWKEDRFA